MPRPKPLDKPRIPAAPDEHGDSHEEVHFLLVLTVWVIAVLILVLAFSLPALALSQHQHTVERPRTSVMTAEPF